MAYTATFSLCAQPLGQIVYGQLFDKLSNAIYLVFLFTGIILCLVGFFSKHFWGKVEQQAHTF